MSWVPGLMSWVPSPGFQVSGLRTYLCDGSQVLRLKSHYQSRVLGPTFQTCRKKVSHLFSEYCIEKKPVINHSHSIKLYFKNNDSFHTWSKWVRRRLNVLLRWILKKALNWCTCYRRTSLNKKMIAFALQLYNFNPLIITCVLFFRLYDPASTLFMLCNQELEQTQQ